MGANLSEQGDRCTAWYSGITVNVVDLGSPGDNANDSINYIYDWSLGVWTVGTC